MATPAALEEPMKKRGSKIAADAADNSFRCITYPPSVPIITPERDDR
jgi:hypothetical protein